MSLNKAMARSGTGAKRIGTESAITVDSVFVPYNIWCERRAAIATTVQTARAARPYLAPAGQSGPIHLASMAMGAERGKPMISPCT